MENVSYRGVSSDHEDHEWTTDLNGEPVELPEAVGYWSADAMRPNFPRYGLCKHRLTTRDGQENTSKAIIVPSTHED